MIRWSYAFIDRPFAGYERALEFWSAVTGTTVSPRRGDLGQFATLVPAAGDACVKVQAVGDGGGAHIDLSVEDVPAYARRAAAMGATEVFAEPDLVVMRSPAGQRFCLVDWEGEATPPGAGVDRVIVGVPPESFESESAFWAGLMAEKIPLPVEIVLQRSTFMRARVGITGDRAWHERHGAVFLERGLMRDPAGGEYELAVS